VTFGLTRDGSPFETRLEPVARDTWFAGANGHLVMSPPARPDGPAWLRQPHVETWWELQADTATAYVQYNVTQSPGDVPQQVADAIAAGSAERVVVDVRHNGGGNNATYGALLELLASPVLAEPGRAYVIVGRATFSAAGNFVAEADQIPHVTLVGEDSGGSPNQYGDAVTLTLEHSGLVLRVAPEFVLRTDPDDVRITVEPDIRAPLSSADYFGDRDPAMEAILADS
jgi:C-terminal processing protease CtpA/Prc